MKQAPSHIAEQIQAILDQNLSEEQARRAYPDVFAWFNAQMPDILRDYGIPIIQQVNDSFIAYRACPDCGQSLEVSNG